MYPSNAVVDDQFLLRRSQHGADLCHDDDDEEEEEDVDDLYLSNAGVDDQLLLRHSQHGADPRHVVGDLVVELATLLSQPSLVLVHPLQRLVQLLKLAAKPLQTQLASHLRQRLHAAARSDSYQIYK